MQRVFLWRFGVISENQVEKAMNYLAETDEDYGKSVGLVKGLEHYLKTVKSQVFLNSSGTVAEREAKSYASKDYREKILEHQNAVTDKEIMAAKRKRAELTVDVWRTQQANRRQG